MSKKIVYFRFEISFEGALFSPESAPFCWCPSTLEVAPPPLHELYFHFILFIVFYKLGYNSTL